MSEYKHPETLVSTQWAADHLNDSNIRLVEVDVDTTAYDQGHIPGAVGWNWQSQLQDNIRRDLIDQGALEALLGQSGISNDTTILLYGDNNNWFAAYAFWQLKYYGHKDVRLINGGRKKWVEEKRALTTEATKVAATKYRATGPDESIRARKEDVFGVLEKKKAGQLVDVRSGDEFTGKIIAPRQLLPFRLARRPDCPIRSTSHRSFSPCRIPEGISKRTRSANCARRSGNTRSVHSFPSRPCLHIALSTLPPI